MRHLPLARFACIWALCMAATLAGAQGERAAPPKADAAARLAEAQADPKLADSLLRSGRKLASFCANCHGDSGNSVNPEVPNLASQNTAYLLEQMRLFSTGVRRNEFMEGLIRAMNAEERAGIVLFYAGQRVQARAAAEAVLTAQGADLFQRICVRCHGAQGLGNEKIPRLAGQQPEYLRLTLKRYRSGTGPRRDPLMAANARLLTDADIDGLVAYVSTMR